MFSMGEVPTKYIGGFLHVHRSFITIYEYLPEDW
jgi:hypothetical protein